MVMFVDPIIPLTHKIVLRKLPLRKCNALSVQQNEYISCNLISFPEEGRLNPKTGGLYAGKADGT